MSGSRHPIKGGIQTADDGHMIILPGEADIESTLFGVQGGYIVGVYGSPITDTEREGNRRDK